MLIVRNKQTYLHMLRAISNIIICIIFFQGELKLAKKKLSMKEVDAVGWKFLK